MNGLPWLTPVRLFIISLMAFGYASTMPRGPETREYLNLFGYDPSWFAINLVFMISGYLALRSLHRHGSALKMLLSRAARNLPTLALFSALVIFVLFPLFGAPPPEGQSRFSQHVHYFFSVVSCLDPGERTPGLLDNALYMCIIHGGLWTFRWGAVAFLATALMWISGVLKNRNLLLGLTLLSVGLYAGIVLYGVRHPELSSKHIYTTLDIGLRLGWVYMVGMCLYAWRDALPRRMMIGILFLFLALVQFLFLPWTPFIEITATLGFGWLAWLAMSSNVPAPVWIRKCPDLSLGIYVYNWPASQIILLMLPGLHPLVLFALSFPTTLILAWLSQWALSGRINRLAAKRLSLQTGLA